MASRFVPNPAFIAEYARSQECGEMLAIVVGVVAGRVQQIYAEESEETGDYGRGIVASAGLDGPTMRGRVADTVPYAGFLEVGTEDTDAHHFLARGAESVGLKLLGGEQ